MPQLSIETFLTQYFWLVIFFFSFYYLNVSKILPTFSTLFKTRNLLAQMTESSNKEESPSILQGKSIISSAITSQYLQSISGLNYQGLFEKSKKSWIKKHKRQTRRKKTSVKS